jgi:hypothetical protein
MEEIHQKYCYFSYINIVHLNNPKKSPITITRNEEKQKEENNNMKCLAPSLPVPCGLGAK